MSYYNSGTLKDYYRILGVESKASYQEIKTAYRQLAKQWHPDVCKKPEANNMFIRVTEAYEVLGNEDARRQYDTIRENPNVYQGDFNKTQQEAQRQAEQYSHMTLDDVLNTIFESVGKAGKIIIYGQVPKGQVGLGYFISSGLKLLLLSILAIISLTGVAIIATAPMFYLLVKSMTNKEDQFMGISNLLKSFLFVTVPLFVLCVFLINSMF